MGSNINVGNWVALMLTRRQKWLLVTKYFRTVLEKKEKIEEKENDLACTCKSLQDLKINFSTQNLEY